MMNSERTECAGKCGDMMMDTGVSFIMRDGQTIRGNSYWCPTCYRYYFLEREK